MLRIFLQSPLKEMIGTMVLFITALPMLFFSIYDGFREEK